MLQFLWVQTPGAGHLPLPLETCACHKSIPARREFPQLMKFMGKRTPVCLLPFMMLLPGLLLSSCSRVPKLLDPAATLAAQNEGALIVDIRPVDDYEEFHIPKSVNIPLSDLPDRMDEIPMEVHVILAGTLGRASLEARDILIEAGYEQVSSLEGGVMAWYDAGYPGISGN